MYNFNKLINYNKNIFEFNLTIQKVKYGAINTFFDITDIVTKMFLKDNKLFIPKETNLNELFTDPYFGCSKELIVYALINVTPVIIREHELSNNLLNDISIDANFFSRTNDLFINGRNNDLNYAIIKNVRFVQEVTEVANDFIEHNKINKNENIDVLYLCFDFYISNLSNLYNIDVSVIKQKIENKYIELIDNYFNKDTKIIVIGNIKNDTIINYLTVNGYNFIVKYNITDDIDYETGVDLEITLNCNSVFIGVDKTLFSQFVRIKNENKKQILITFDNGEVSENTITRGYLK